MKKIVFMYIDSIR